jgi:HEAT repeat protein
VLLLTTSFWRPQKYILVYDAVQLAVLLVDKLLQSFPVFALGDIGAEEVALELVGRLLAKFFCKVCDNDLRALCKELLGNAFTESCCRSV